MAHIHAFRASFDGKASFSCVCPVPTTTSSNHTNPKPFGEYFWTGHMNELNYAAGFGAFPLAKGHQSGSEVMQDPKVRRTKNLPRADEDPLSAGGRHKDYLGCSPCNTHT
jgi:hypothetical protein